MQAFRSFFFSSNTDAAPSEPASPAAVISSNLKKLRLYGKLSDVGRIRRLAAVSVVIAVTMCIIVRHYITPKPLGPMSILLSIVVLVVQPSIRIWRSNSYTRSPGEALDVVFGLSLVAYVVVTYTLVIPSFSAGLVWDGALLPISLFLVTVAQVRKCLCCTTLCMCVSFYSVM